jgi:hypothetical protein
LLVSETEPKGGARLSRARMFPLSRIDCLTEETVETPLCSVSSIVSSGYVVRPPHVRQE